MASRDLNELLPQTKNKALAFDNGARDAGIDYIVTCTYRPDEEQGALYIQGRAPLAVVNDIRAKVGLAQITEEENGRKVTNARPGQSFHARRRAFDVVPIIAGKACWNAGHPAWLELGKIGQRCGLVWGATWTTFTEYAHFQDETVYTEAQTND